MRALRFAFFAVCLIGGFLPVSEARACAVPVFRYALERWAGDPFNLVIFTKGALDPALDKALKKLQPSSTDANGQRANWSVVTVDVDKPVPELWADLWSTQKNEALPRVVLCTPEWRKGDTALWSGALSADTISSIADSPKRAEITGQLLKGTAVVWVIVETADEAKTREMEQLVDTESLRLAKEIQIPPGIGEDGVEVHSKLPLAVSFATVRVRANDPAEAMLIRLLTNKDSVSEPMLFPVFGRARALVALPAVKVNKDLLEEVARFICGACSCQVKQQNPGFDLLVKADWESIFGDQPAPPVEKEAKVNGNAQYVPIPKGKAK